MRSLLKSSEGSFTSKFDSGAGITRLHFCTCHDNSVTIAWPKSWPDVIVFCCVTRIHIFTIFALWAYKRFVKWVSSDAYKSHWTGSLTVQVMVHLSFSTPYPHQWQPHNLVIVRWTLRAELENNSQYNEWLKHLSSNLPHLRTFYTGFCGNEWIL